MAKLKRGNYFFLTYIGDHSPRHVHVYKNSKLIVKWDLENKAEMKGKMTAQILRHIKALEDEKLI